VEKFVLEQIRRIFEDEFVWPSFWTFLVWLMDFYIYVYIHIFSSYVVSYHDTEQIIIIIIITSALEWRRNKAGKLVAILLIFHKIHTMNKFS
jgi:hypothetical protein